MIASILIVDDNKHNREILEAKLLMEYYVVYSAERGKQALEMLAANKIDVILLDAMMPEMNGFETCKKIKANPETTHIPVVMVTALSDTEDRIKGLEAGADEFLSKPVNDIALFARVKSLTRIKFIMDTLLLRNATNTALGLSVVAMNDNFADKKILLINDDLVEARNIKIALTKLSPHIRVVADYNEIKNDLQYIPNLIILDCRIDQSNHPEYNDPLRIITMLKASKQYNDAIIILLADSEEDLSVVIKGMDLGINDYFIYPLDETELLTRIKTQLRRQQYQENLRNNLERHLDLSVKDSLTGLFNRHYFDMHIIQMTKKSRDAQHPLCLMMCDMDDFKQVNDIYGHQAGDKILQTLANILKGHFRMTDLTARFGGEEFVILLDNLSIAEAEKLAEKLKEKIEKTEFKIGGQHKPLKKTICIGIAEYKPSENIAHFIERADKAMYLAKKSGKNKVVRIV